MEAFSTDLAVLSEEACEHILERHIKCVPGTSQFLVSCRIFFGLIERKINLKSLLISTVTELDRRNREENSTLYHPVLLKKTKGYVYMVPKSGKDYHTGRFMNNKKACVIDVGFPVGRTIRGELTSQVDVVVRKEGKQWYIVTAFPS